MRARKESLSHTLQQVATRESPFSVKRPVARKLFDSDSDMMLGPRRTAPRRGPRHRVKTVSFIDSAEQRLKVYNTIRSIFMRQTSRTDPVPLSTAVQAVVRVMGGDQHVGPLSAQKMVRIVCETAGSPFTIKTKPRDVTATPGPRSEIIGVSMMNLDNSMVMGRYKKRLAEEAKGDIIG